MAPSGDPILNGLRVLVIEDSWPVASALKSLFEILGADVLGPVATTAEAAQLIFEKAIDVAVVDINLRGGELAYKLIDQMHDRGIRIVVLTGYDDVQLGQGKVAAILHKPVRTKFAAPELTAGGARRCGGPVTGPKPRAVKWSSLGGRRSIYQVPRAPLQTAIPVREP